jgi:hypothetical protein
MAQDFQDPDGQGARESQDRLVGLLDELDAAYDLSARAGGTLAGSARWLGIQTLADLLRDVRDELDAAVGASAEIGSEGRPTGVSAQAFALVRTVTTVAARRIAVLAKEIAVKLGADGLRRSPLGSALRRIQRAGEAIADFGAPPTPLTAARFATGRGALQAQLAAMRRELRTAADRPAA